MPIIIAVFLSLFCCFSVVQSTYFHGGTVSWRYSNLTNASVREAIIFTQSYQWEQSQTLCDQSLIVNRTQQVPSGSDLLACVTSPSSACGGYSSLSVNGYCTDFSSNLTSSLTQRSDAEVIRMGSNFCVAYQGAIWPRLRSPGCSYTCFVNQSKGSISTCVNLTPRSDGSINSPPVVAIVSPIRVNTKSSMDIYIGVTDENWDDLRCRWATNTSALDECGEICGAIPGSTLPPNSCTLSLDTSGLNAGEVYAVALMIEDFVDSTSTTPLSSVPIQFLVEIVAKPSCLLKPRINSDAPEGIYLPVGSLFQLTLFIETDCPGRTIVEVYRMSPLDMFRNDSVRDSGTNVTTTTESWIPTIDQIGSHMYCAITVDSSAVQSDMYCLLMVVYIIETTTTTSTTTTSLTTTSATMAVTFNNQTTVVPASTVTVTVIVIQSVPTTDNTAAIGLALGLGIPLLLLATGLLSYGLYRRKCSSDSVKTGQRPFDQGGKVENQSPSIDKTDPTPAKASAPAPNYREQYIREGEDPDLERPSTPSDDDDDYSLPEENRFGSTSVSQINMTRTSFFPSSINHFANESVSAQSNSTTELIPPAVSGGSLLVRAYSQQVQKKN